MKRIVTTCPACGGNVEFRVRSSRLSVCEFCRSLVARGDRAPQDYGKVADLVETGSPLRLGVRGRFRGRPFEIIGRVQFQHAAGGVWDEWYAALPGDRWGWVAEAQGHTYFTFQRKLPADTKPPAWEDLKPGSAVKVGKFGAMTISEVGTAKPIAAEGELPFSFRAFDERRYADLQGAAGSFATLNFSAEPLELFVGQEVSLEKLGIPKEAMPADAGERRVAGVQLNCPKCGGPLTLHVPDQSERIGCPNCAALLDVNDGKLSYLKQLKGKIEPEIPLGRAGTLFGVEYTVIGMMERFVVYDGTKYPWTEYLLHQPREGFRWLVHSDKHWSFVRPVSAHEVDAGLMQAVYGGMTFKIFQRATAVVRFVVGEFYWRVEVGEKVGVQDFIAPPHMISIEESRHDSGTGTAAAEVNHSLGVYVPHAEIEKAFGVERLPRGWGVAPNQPNPVGWSVFLLWGLFVIVLLGIYAVCSEVIKSRVDGSFFVMALIMISVIPVGAVIFCAGFESSRWKDSEFGPSASSD